MAEFLLVHEPVEDTERGVFAAVAGPTPARIDSHLADAVSCGHGVRVEVVRDVSVPDAESVRVSRRAERAVREACKRSLGIGVVVARVDDKFRIVHRLDGRLEQVAARNGETGVREMITETIASALRNKVAKKKDFERVNVDTTAQEKNVRFPTDARTLDRARERVVSVGGRLVKLMKGLKKKWLKSLFLCLREVTDGMARIIAGLRDQFMPPTVSERLAAGGVACRHPRFGNWAFA